MARFVGTTQGTCRRELNKLVDFGILTASKEGNLQYYQLNKKNPLYKEFKIIIQKTIGIEAILKSALLGIEGISYAFIFGSYVKDELRHDSDIDIVVIGNLREEHLIKLLKPVEKKIEREINYHIYTEKEFLSKLKRNSFVMNIIEDYIIVSGDERKFRKLLKKT
jgi:predicted nucleotidyltransferase